MCDYADAALARAAAQMEAQVTALREEWSCNAAHQVAAAEARTRQLQEDSLQWLRSRADDGDQGAHIDVAAGDHRGDASATAAASYGTGHGPRQQPTQHEQELAEASRLKNMTMQQFALERQQLIRSGRGMF